jgi:hypothetical protein
MSLLMDSAPQQLIKRADALPALSLVGAVLLLAAWAAATVNLDMGWMSSTLPIGP